MTAHDEQKLVGVHPALALRVGRVLEQMAQLGHPMMVTDGVRTVAQQQALYAQGRTTPGRIVTKADGIRYASNHQAKGDGFGYAVDLAFVVDGEPSWDEYLPWQTYGNVAKAQGLAWGGDWGSALVDRPHVEWKGQESMTAREIFSPAQLDQAIHDTLIDVPRGKSGALIIVATTEGAKAAVAQKLGDNWTIGGYVAWTPTDGFSAGAKVQASW